MQITVVDRKSFAINSKRQYTDEGFLKVPGRVARIGIQEYLASELGITDRNPNDIIKVYRPDEEVFSEDSLNTYEGVDVTIEHPKDMVDANTFKSVTAGVVVKAYRDGDFVQANLIIKDKSAIQAVERGKVELSAGYTAVYDDNVPGGADYDFIQRDIKINHVALVDRARAGAQARLFDHSRKVQPMKITLDSGRSVEVQDDASAALIEDTFNRLKAQAIDAENALKEAQDMCARAQAEKDKMEEEMEEEKKKSSDAALAERVKAISEAKDAARKIAGEKFSCDSLDILEIKKAALKEVRKSVDWDAKEVAYIDAAFDMQIEGADSKDAKPSNDAQIQQIAQDAAKPSNDANPRQKTMDSMVGAWKKTVKEA